MSENRKKSMNEGYTLFNPGENGSFDFNEEMRLIAERYQAEDTLLKAIAKGDEQGALDAFYEYGRLMQNPQQKTADTSEDPLRDFKNSVLVMNTLFRKAIEGNYVHPIYIHESSSYFGKEIEAAQNEGRLIRIIRDMVHVYCELVRQSSLGRYSETVRQAILYIDMNLTSVIGTKEIAAHLFLTPNYVSARFHQETGTSISEFILQRRINLACHLLTDTSMSIQNIAAATGMSDASYFIRQFRKVKGISPLKYRKTEMSLKQKQKEGDESPGMDYNGYGSMAASNCGIYGNNMSEEIIV